MQERGGTQQKLKKKKEKEKEGNKVDKEGQKENKEEEGREPTAEGVHAKEVDEAARAYLQRMEDGTIPSLFLPILSTPPYSPLYLPLSLPLFLSLSLLGAPTALAMWS